MPTVMTVGALVSWPSWHFHLYGNCCFPCFNSFSFCCCRCFLEFSWIVRICFWYSTQSGFFEFCCLRTLQDVNVQCVSFPPNWNFNKSFDKYHVCKNILSALKKNTEISMVIHMYDNNIHLVPNKVVHQARTKEIFFQSHYSTRLRSKLCVLESWKLQNFNTMIWQVIGCLISQLNDTIIPWITVVTCADKSIKSPVRQFYLTNLILSTKNLNLLSFRFCITGFLGFVGSGLLETMTGILSTCRTRGILKNVAWVSETQFAENQ